MKRSIKWTSVLPLIALFFAVGSTDALAQKRKPVIKRKVAVKKAVKAVPTVRTYAVATGTVVRARMNKTISSKTARVGESFTVTVTEPVYSNTGVVVVPVGSTIYGRVNSVRPAAKGGKPGEIDASFVRVRLPNGTSRSINGSLTELTSGAESDNEGTATGKRMKNRKVIFIGGGGVGGVLLGGAIGGGKGALIGGLLGAGGGYLGERMTKGPEAEVRTGTEFGIYLNQRILLPRYAESPDRNL